jgi:hypothetical protein
MGKFTVTGPTAYTPEPPKLLVKDLPTGTILKIGDSIMLITAGKSGDVPKYITMLDSLQFPYTIPLADSVRGDATDYTILNNVPVKLSWSAS